MRYKSKMLASKHMTRKRILNDISVYLVSGGSKEGGKYKRMIANTLLRIPERVRRKVVQDVLFIMAHKPLLALMGTTDLNLSKKERKGRISVNLIYIDFHGIKRAGKSEEEMKQIIAHEIAHFELKHNRKNGRNDEEKAEEQTRVWGFSPKRSLVEKIKDSIFWRQLTLYWSGLGKRPKRC